MAMSGNDWDTYDLCAYNITIQFQDTVTFFGMDPLPQLSLVSNEIFSNQSLLFHMDRAMLGMGVHSFGFQLLKALGYESFNSTLITGERIILTICGEQHYTNPNVCLLDMDDDNILLLLRANKEPEELEFSQKDPEPQLIAEAIAAFQRDNARRHTLGQDPIDVKVMPAIVLTGSSPTFLKIPVTKELAQAVELGQFPTTPTTVCAHLPVVPSPTLHLCDILKPLDNQRQILACFEAFKLFVKGYYDGWIWGSLWTQTIVSENAQIHYGFLCNCFTGVFTRLYWWSFFNIAYCLLAC